MTEPFTPYQTLDEAAMHDASLHRILESGLDDRSNLLLIVNLNRLLTNRIAELSAIAPRRLRLPNGHTVVWRCPEELIPIESAVIVGHAAQGAQDP